MALLFYSEPDDREPWMESLGRHLPDLEVRVWPDIGDPDEIEYALVWQPPRGMLAGLPRLQAILSLGAGVEHITGDPELPRDVPLVRLVDPGLTVGMTEFVVMRVLHYHRRMPEYEAQQRERVWRLLAQTHPADRRIGILGLGELGGAAARARAGLGFDVAGWSRGPKSIAGIACHHGEDGLFEDQLERGLELFAKRNITDVVTSSPHCFHTLRRDYPRFEEQRPAAERTTPRARHYVHLLDELIAAGDLAPEGIADTRVTYHDPCYLGRHNGVYEAPRRVLRAVPGVELVEMPRHGAHSLCCGGGGGRMWQEELDAEEKMSEVRVREAAATGAQIVVTACPLCLIMLDDARKTAGTERSLKVMDLSELLVEALGDAGRPRAKTEAEP